MPGLLLLFSSGMDRTMHKNFVPKITAWGGIVVKTRFLLLPVFLVVLVIGIFLSGRCPYVFSTNSIESGNLPDYMIAAQRIRDAFGESNTIAVLVPKGDYDKEGRVLREVEALEPVTSATGLANIEVEDGRMLTDKMGPRQFAELAGIDIDLARLLYRAYGVSVEEYGAIFQDTDNYSAPLLDVFQFLLEQKDLGVVNLTGEQAEKVEDLQETLDDGLAQLQGNDWSRLVFVADVPEESEETFRLLDQIREITRKYYGEEAIIVGNSTNARDLQESFQQDNLKISVLTVVFVMVILLFTFQSAGLPVLLVLTIQGSIWINFSFPYLTHSPMYFLAYLIVSAIQMGATIDYAIVITNRYLELKTQMNRKDAVVETLNQSFPTILTSGSIMTVAGFLIYGISTDPTIGSLGLALGRGTLTSILLVMSVLPQILLLGDALIEKTAFTLSRGRKQRIDGGLFRVNGRIRGQVYGYVDGEINGMILGRVEAMINNHTNPAAEPAPSEEDKAPVRELPETWEPELSTKEEREETDNERDEQGH